MSKDAEVTIGIVYHKGFKQIENCLLSILNQKNAPKYFLILVNNGSICIEDKQKLDELLLRAGVPHRHINNIENNIGLARQLVLDNCQTDFVAYTDPDCIVAENWLFSLLNNFKKVNHDHKNLAAVGG